MIHVHEVPPIRELSVPSRATDAAVLTGVKARCRR
jgi:hypothetical protein